MGNFKHRDLEISDGLHGIVSGTFPDAATRLAAAGFTDDDGLHAWSANDIFKTAIDLDTGDFFIIVDPLSTPTPTWVQLTNVATPSVFGNDYQRVMDVPRITTTSTVFQTATTLTTPALTGTYLVSWGAVVDQNSAADAVQAQLVEDPGGSNTLIGPIREHEPKDPNNRIDVVGSEEVVFTGVAKTFGIQYRQQRGNTAGIQNRYIMLWRVA